MRVTVVPAPIHRAAPDARGMPSLGARSVLGVDISACTVEQARAKAAALAPAEDTVGEAD